MIFDGIILYSIIVFSALCCGFGLLFTDPFLDFSKPDLILPGVFLLILGVIGLIAANIITW